MSNLSVQSYIYIGDQYAFPPYGEGNGPKESLVDRVTEDYQASLAGHDLELAIREVEIMRRATNFAEWAAFQRFVDWLRSQDLLLMAVDAEACATAISTATQASNDAAAAQTAATNAATSASAAQAAATAAQSAAAAAQATIAGGCRVSLKATNLAPMLVDNGPGASTLIPWPSDAILPVPYTRNASAWSIVNGVLHGEEPGVYLYILSGSFTTGLLALNLPAAFRFVVENVADGGGMLDAIEHIAQVALLTFPTGLVGAGMIVIPEGGGSVPLRAGHSALPETQCTFSELRMTMIKVDLE